MNKIFAKFAIFVLVLGLTFSNTFAATIVWDFSTASDYTFDNTKIEIIAAQAQLKSTSTPSWYNGSWKYRKKITIDHTKIPSDLTDFPVLINQASDSDLVSKALATGNDILFTTSDGVTKLNHELEVYASTTGAFTAWIKVPSVSSSVDTDIYMYYGNATSSAQANQSGVWDSNSVTTLHLTGTSSPSRDSTSNVNNAVQAGGVVFNAAGKIGNSISMDGVDDKLSMTSNASLNATGSVSISAWINRTATGKMRIIAKTVTTGATDNPYDFGINTDNTLYFNRANSTAVNFLSSSSTIPINTWTKVEVVDGQKSAFNNVSNLFTLATSTRTWQGVASDGNNLYTIGQNNAISKFDMQGNFIMERVNAYSGLAGANIFGNGTVINNKLYVTAYNANTLGASTNINYTPVSDLQSKIAVFNLSDLSLIEDFNLGTQVKVAEGIDYHDGYFWVVDGWFNTFKVMKYDSSFNLISTYTLPVVNPDPDQLTYQNLNWYGNDIFVNWHGSNSPGLTYAYGLDHYSFDGTNFNFVERLKPVVYGAGQGIAIVGNTFYWADRPGNAIYKSTYVGAGNGDIDPVFTKFIINGVAELGHVSSGSLIQMTPTTNTSPTVVGTRGDSTNFYKGAIDEIRISNTARSQAWISASYANENSPSTFYSVSLEQKSYTTSNPTISPTSSNSRTFVSLTGFSTIEQANGGNIRYQISNDNGSTWYWYNSGWNITSSGYAEANASTTINSNIASFPLGSGTFLFKAYLNSDGIQLPQIDSVTLEYSAPVVVVPSNGGGSSYTSGGSSASYGPQVVVSSSTSSANQATVPTYACNNVTKTCTITYAVISGPSLPSAASGLVLFARNLKANIEGNDVLALQQFLNKQGFTIAKSGAGSKGKETTFFGPATKNALIRFQKYYKIYPSVGFFGPLTKQFIKTKFGVE